MEKFTAQQYLEMLTPGGSEFYNNPKGCYEYIQQLIQNQHKKILEEVKKRKYLEQQLNH